MKKVLRCFSALVGFSFRCRSHYYSHPFLAMCVQPTQFPAARVRPYLHNESLFATNLVASMRFLLFSHHRMSTVHSRSPARQPSRRFSHELSKGSRSTPYLSGLAIETVSVEAFDGLDIVEQVRRWGRSVRLLGTSLKAALNWFQYLKGGVFNFNSVKNFTVS